MIEDRRTNRVMEVDLGSMDAKQKAVLERAKAGRGKVLTPQKILIHAPEVADGMGTVGAYINNGSSLTAQDLELAILATGVFWRSPQVTKAHLAHARHVGVDEAAIERVLGGERAQLDYPHSQAIHDFTRAALAGGSMSDEDFRRYESSIGRKTMAEILGLIGYYTTVSLGMNTHEVLL